MAHNLLLGLVAVLCLAGSSLLQADATPVPPPAPAKTCPIPPVQLESNTSLLVHTPPNIDYIRYGRLENIQTVNYANVTELYVIALELYQTLLFLPGTMVSVVQYCKFYVLKFENVHGVIYHAIVISAETGMIIIGE